MFEATCISHHQDKEMKKQEHAASLAVSLGSGSGCREGGRWQKKKSTAVGFDAGWLEHLLGRLGERAPGGRPIGAMGGGGGG